MTAPYLAPDELADVWGNIKSTPCYRNGGGDTKAWADLLAAISARNAPEIVTLGAHLLGPPSDLSKDELTYLATVMAAAYIRMGEASQASNLLAAQSDRLDFGGAFSLALRELFALAREGDAHAFALAGADKLIDPSLGNP
jgi:hypothetical protein